MTSEANPVSGESTAPDASPDWTDSRRALVVGVGASAGGLEAFLVFVAALPKDTGMAFVLVQHLDPSHESSLVELLSRHSALPVQEANDGLEVTANCIYVIPPNAAMSIDQGHLRLTPRGKSRTPQLPIDYFFQSLAADCKDNAIGIVLSGSGTDGTLGVAEIRTAGGMTFAQEPDSAKYDSMPRSAIHDGKVDFVMTVEQIVAQLCRIASNPLLKRPVSDDADDSEASASASVKSKPYSAIMKLLRAAFGVDFSQYRKTTVRRRIMRRMVLYHEDALEDYAARLQDDEDELESLYEDILINVTSFFRDPEVFETLADKVFPEILENRKPGAPIRIWVAGCSTGQEPYSLAIALTEFLENKPGAPDIQIFATDLSDSGSLSKARDGLYAENIETQMSSGRLRRFFRKEDGGYRIAKSIRDVCVFARQNIAVDPPFSRLDLVSCRNVLIYLSPTLQKRIIPSFHYALNAGGYLLLGSSESISGFSDLFEPATKENKIFVRKNAVARQYPHFTSSRRMPDTIAKGDAPEWPPTVTEWQKEADRIVIGDYAPAGVLVNSNMDILQFRGRTSRYLEPASGEASFNLLKMAREGLFGELRQGIAEARRNNASFERRHVQMRVDNHKYLVDLRFIPISLPNAGDMCTLVLFDESRPTDASGEASARPGIDSRDSNAGKGDAAEAVMATPDAQHAMSLDRDEELEQLRRELIATRDHQQAILEEREVANEELQTANEEVLSSNEELQSTNEELETAKEELQSLNEELTTVNEQLQNRNEELGQAHNDLVNFFGSTHIPIIMIDSEMRLRRFTPAAEKLLYLHPRDIGQPLSTVRLGIEVPDLEKLVENVQDTMQRTELEVQDRDGSWYAARIRPYRTMDNKIDGAVLALIDIDDVKQSQQRYIDIARYADAIVATLHESLLVLDADLRVQTANQTYLAMFNVSREQTEGKNLFELGNAQWDTEPLRRVLDETLLRDGQVADYEVDHDFPEIGRKTMLLNARRLLQKHSDVEMILLAIDDVTERRRLEEEQIELRAQQRASEAQAHLAAIVESTDDAIISVDMNGCVRSWNQGAVQMFDYSEQEMLGKPVLDLSPAKIRNQNESFFKTLLQNQQVAHFDTLNVNREGDVLEVSLTACPMFDDAGRITGGSIIARDISRARRVAKQLEQADRRKNEFVAMLAHELRNPLAAVSSAVELLGTRGGAERLDSVRGIITRQTNNLSHLVDDLLDMSRITSGVIHLRKGIVDVAAAIDRAVETVVPMMEARDHDLQVTIRNESLWVEGDSTRLEQIVMNLLSNSAKYTEPRGRIELIAERMGQTVVITVRDNGTGISPELLPHVFELFSRSRRASDPGATGLGIGLALVKSLAEMHGGSVEARSGGPNTGSEFTVRLPVIAGGGSSLATNLHEPLPARDVNRRVLLIDDNVDAASALSQLLEVIGYDIRIAYNGPDGIDAAIAHKPHVILLDISLPGMDGYDVARRLRKEPALAGTMLIAISGFCQETDRQRSRAAGFDHHLAKPADIKLLLKLIGESTAGEQQARKDA